MDEIDRSGIRLGVTKVSTSERMLSAKFRNAAIVAAESVTLAVICSSAAKSTPRRPTRPFSSRCRTRCRARILDGNWGFEHTAIAIPKEHSAGMEVLKVFVHDVQSSGLLKQLLRQAGLRGAVIEADAR